MINNNNTNITILFEINYIFIKKNDKICKTFNNTSDEQIWFIYVVWNSFNYDPS